MKCTNCNFEVAASTKFCPNCGKPIIEENANIQSNEMNIEWLEDTIKLSGYKVDHEKCEGLEFRATKENRVTVYVALKKDLKIITFNSYIPFKNLSRSDKEAILEILNLSNGKGTYCTFFANLNNNFLNVYSFFPITETISKHDFLHVFERFGDEMGITAVATKLIDYVL